MDSMIYSNATTLPLIEPLEFHTAELNEVQR